MFEETLVAVDVFGRIYNLSLKREGEIIKTNYVEGKSIKSISIGRRFFVGVVDSQEKSNYPDRTDQKRSFRNRMEDGSRDYEALQSMVKSELLKDDYKQEFIRRIEPEARKSASRSKSRQAEKRSSAQGDQSKDRKQKVKKIKRDTSDLSKNIESLEKDAERLSKKGKDVDLRKPKEPLKE